MLRAQKLVPKLPPRAQRALIRLVGRRRFTHWSFGHYLDIAPAGDGRPPPHPRDAGEPDERSGRSRPPPSRLPRAEITDRELRLLRMRAQCLLPGSERESVAAARVGCARDQAQDVATGLLGVRARTTGLTAAKAAQGAPGACRSWLMRNTLFLFAERDLAWMRPVLAERPLTPRSAGSARWGCPG